jgi:dolichyl-phosphate beta-glucosyltransferase
MGKMGNLFIQALLAPGIHDTQRGFKMLTARAADAIIPHMKVDGWAFDVEMLALARRHHFKIKELSVKWSNNMETSKVNASAYLEVLLECVKIRFNLLRGAYN